MLIATGFPSLAYDSSFTFAGVLQRYFSIINKENVEVGLRRHWNDTTTERYASQYEKKVIPTINELLGKEYPISRLTEEDIELTLNNLRDQYHYSDSTIQHYRYLIWIVYRAGFQNGLYEDNIFWDEIEDSDDQDKDAIASHNIEVMTRLRKSFSIDEELQIIEWFQSLSPETATGEQIGLLIMFFEGFRNNEACGTNFSAVHCLSKYSTIPVIEMLQTTRIDSNTVKSGGKTRNAPRVLPLFLALYIFIMKRRMYLDELVHSGVLHLPENVNDVNDLPLVCKGLDFTVRAQSSDLSREGRLLFQKIGISKTVLAKLHQMLCTTEFSELRIEERDPTTYLFRRNVATHLRQLNFTLPEIQYFLGHDIEDIQQTRNALSSDDSVAKLARKFTQHPLNNLQTESLPSKHVDVSVPTVMDRDVCSVSVVCKTDTNNRNVAIHVTTNEPGDPVIVNISSDNTNFSVTSINSYPESNYSQEVMIHSIVTAAYKRHYEARKAFNADLSVENT